MGNYRPRLVKPWHFHRGRLGSSLVIAILFSYADGTVLADSRLDEIIQNVAANERLYDNLELVIQERYRWIGPADSPRFRNGLVTASQDAESRYVYQDGLIFHHNLSHGEKSAPSGGLSRMMGGQYASQQAPKVDASGRVHFESSYTLGYDGEHTRCVDDTSANIHRGRFAPRNLVRAHCIIFLDEPTLMRPLSEYLSAAKIGPNDIGHQVVYEGEETVDGLPCVRIRSEQFYAAGQPPDVTLLWLAVERNYLPVKLVGYVVSYSTDIPLVVSTVSDLRELAPGVWFPFAQTRIKNDEIAASKGQTLVVTRTDNTVTKAVLGPQYDLSLFREISIPDGMPVIEIKEGEKVRDYVQGHAPPTPARSSRWWLLLLAAVVLIAGVWQLWRRRATGGSFSR